MILLVTAPSNGTAETEISASTSRASSLNSAQFYMFTLCCITIHHSTYVSLCMYVYMYEYAYTSSGLCMMHPSLASKWIGFRGNVGSSDPPFLSLPLWTGHQEYMATWPPY